MNLYLIFYFKHNIIITYYELCTFSFCKKLKSIDFPDESEIKIIENNKFINSSLEQIPSVLNR